MSVTAHSQSKTRVRGFTLIELMTTVAVLGVVAAISYASLDRMLSRARARTAYQELVSTLEHTREVALVRGVPTFFRIVPPPPMSDKGILIDAYVDTRAALDTSDFDPDDTPFPRLARRELPPTLKLHSPAVAPTLPAPFSTVPADAACTFCEGSGPTYIVFGSDGSARLGSTPADHPLGGSIALHDSVKNEDFTIAILGRGFIRSFER